MTLPEGSGNGKPEQELLGPADADRRHKHKHKHKHKHHKKHKDHERSPSKRGGEGGSEPEDGEIVLENGAADVSHEKLPSTRPAASGPAAAPSQAAEATDVVAPTDAPSPAAAPAEGPRHGRVASGKVEDADEDGHAAVQRARTVHEHEPEPENVAGASRSGRGARDRRHDGGDGRSRALAEEQLKGSTASLPLPPPPPATADRADATAYTDDPRQQPSTRGEDGATAVAGGGSSKHARDGDAGGSQRASDSSRHASRGRRDEGDREISREVVPDRARRGESDRAERGHSRERGHDRVVDDPALAQRGGGYSRERGADRSDVAYHRPRADRVRGGGEEQRASDRPGGEDDQARLASSRQDATAGRDRSSSRHRAREHEQRPRDSSRGDRHRSRDGRDGKDDDRRRDDRPSDRHRDDRNAAGRGSERDYDRRHRERRERGDAEEDRAAKRRRGGDEEDHRGEGRNGGSNGRDRDRGRGRRGARDAEDEEQQDDGGDDASALVTGMEVDEEEAELARIEESRKRRQAILAKHREQQQQAASVAAPTATAMAAATAATAAPSRGASPALSGLQPMEVDVADGGATAAANGTGDGDRSMPGSPAGGGGSSGSGSDSDGEDNDGPVVDVYNLNEEAAGPAIPDELTSQLPAPFTEPHLDTERLRAPKAPAAAAGGDDMFAEEAPAEVDDMFADVPVDAGEGGAVAAVRRNATTAAAAAGALADSYDDAEGYYKLSIGELMDGGRYEVLANKGKGVFSTVVQARELTRRDELNNHPEVAIKMIRANETMQKAALTEIAVLRVLAAQDPEGRKHCVRLLRSFEYRNHMCLVFEHMDMNLRELTNKYGRKVGLNINAVAMFTCQLLTALRHLRKCGVLHADIKPDNILVNKKHTKVKICDFGSAMMAGDVEVTPYLVSRFYRAPEVVLGLKYDFSMDMWSIGCVIYELFTGKILFPGRTNNEMLKLMMDVKGPFPKKMLKRGAFIEKHFEGDANMTFALMEEDPLTQKMVRRLVPNPAVKHSFATLLSRSSVGEADRVKVAQLADLLEKIMTLDPDKRWSAELALRHPFVKESLPAKKKQGHGHDKQKQ